ncbi:spore germination protein [Sporolactobacillus sp. Y61]|jgi:stage V sporulation protein AF|uniref:Spore germination protein n=1 Tax=Sporolactobacillus sp. Y61 TaxID=3160863 RepID=A0AAU8IE70_9BACL|nr:spore germination protein [Sporolactobacillus sp. THM19-2]RYL93191.1 spore germination protein [Sporolactobacillus sp. THM19-2]
MASQTEKKPISKFIDDNVRKMYNILDIGPENFDVGERDIRILGRSCRMYYTNSLADSSMITIMMREFMRITNNNEHTLDIFKEIKQHLVHYQVEEITTLNEVIDKMLTGRIVIIIDGETTGLSIDLRHYPGRQPQEPDVEKVVRGSKDGFTENIIENSGLIRRRIRDPRFRSEIMQVGVRSRTDVCLCYLKDVANPGILKTLRQELKAINVDGIPMADNALEEFIMKQGWNPFPLVRYTGRPDVAASHLLEGHVVLISDTSPSVMILPTTLFHHLQHVEEYRQVTVTGALLRWIRFIAVFSSIFLVPLWLLLVQDHLLPEQLSFIGPNKTDYNLPLIVQILIAEAGIESLRMAAIHTPTSLSTALGLIAAVLIGQIAIEAGVFIPEVILYTSVAAIGGFATPSYELQLADKIMRLLLILAVAFFHVPGFMIFTTWMIIYLAHVKNLDTPYLWPFIPFNPTGLYNILIRRAMPTSIVRPSIVRPLDKYRQPKKSGNS